MKNNRDKMNEAKKKAPAQEKRAMRQENKAEAGKKIHKRVNQSITNKSKNEKAAKQNIASPCPVSKKCGGCKWIDKEYAVQLKEKEKWVKELLAPFCKTEAIIGMENPTHYRNKVHAVFGEDRKHNIISGIYEEGTHKIVPVDSCLIENEKADAIIVSVRELLKSFKIRPYNEDMVCFDMY